MTNVECAVCLEQYVDPRVLPCGHTFCQRCITPMVISGRVQCPVDRRTFPVQPGGFPRNYVAQEMSIQHHPNAVVPEITRERSNTRVEVYVIDNDTGSGRNQQECSRAYRKTLYKNLQKLVDVEQRNRSSAIVAVFLVATFSRFIAGVVKLSSDCPMEKNVAVYLFAKSWLGFLFWITILALILTKKMRQAFKNWFFELYLSANTLFALIWFIVGCVWTYGNYGEIRNECPMKDSDYSDHFINFCVFVMTGDLIASITFIIFFIVFSL